MKSLLRTKRLNRLLPPLVLLVVTVCTYMPSTLFLGNIDEFAIDYISVVPIIIGVSLAVSAIVLLVGMLPFPEKAFDIYRMLIFGAAIGFYIQGNFLNPEFKSLNGTEIDWAEYAVHGIISAAAWVLCLALPVVIYIFRKQIMNAASKWVSLFLAAVQLLSLVMMLIMTDKNVDSSYALTRNQEFAMSKNKNIVTFVIDTLDAQWAEEYIIGDSQYAQLLSDFTYFDDVVAEGAPTELGIPTLLTGMSYDTKSTMEEYHEQAYAQSTLFSDLQANNYDVRIYTDYSYLNGADKENVNNLVPGQEYKIASTYSFTKYLYKLTGFYAMPQLLKSRFWFYGNDLSECVKVADDSVQLYYFDDAKFYKDFKAESLTAQDGRNVFALYHLFGAHTPYTMDENCNRVENSTIKQQIDGNLKIVSEYIEQMKSAGIYDDSTIIITADHGGVDLYQNPAVFVKRSGVTQEAMAVSSVPGTFKNLRATMAAAALQDYSAYGKTLYELEDENVVRYHVAPKEIGSVIYPDDSYVSEREWCRYEIRGRARDMSKISVVHE